LSTYRFTKQYNLWQVVDELSAGNIEPSIYNKKIIDLDKRLTEEGYTAHEYLFYFVEEYIGLGGLSDLRIINKWTSDPVWIAFLNYKRDVAENVERWFTIQMNDVNLRLDNNLSTVSDILNSKFTAAGMIVKMDLAFQHYKTDEKVQQYMKKNFHVGRIYIRGNPEYLPYTKYTTEYLINEGNVEYVG
jgi:hypothetical protein